MKEVDLEQFKALMMGSTPDEAVALAGEFRYSDDQARDDNGRFASGSAAAKSHEEEAGRHKNEAASLDKSAPHFVAGETKDAIKAAAGAHEEAARLHLKAADDAKNGVKSNATANSAKEATKAAIQKSKDVHEMIWGTGRGPIRMDRSAEQEAEQRPAVNANLKGWLESRNTFKQS